MVPLHSNGIYAVALADLIFMIMRHPARALRAVNRDTLPSFMRYLKDGNLTALAARIDEALADDRHELPRLAHGSVAPDTPIVFPLCDTPLATIIIVAKSDWVHTHSCLTSIQRNSGTIPIEVIVADNGATDLACRCRDLVPGVRVFEDDTTAGEHAICDKAAMLARGNYLVFLHDDTEVQKGWLSAMVQTMGEGEAIGLVGPKLIHPDGSLQEAGGIVWSNAETLSIGNGDNPSKPQYSYRREVDYLPDTCIMVNKSFWERTDGFEARLGPWNELDFAFTARKLGFQVMFEPKSVVVHFGRGRCEDRDTDSDNRTAFLAKWRVTLSREHTAAEKGTFLARDRSRGRKTLLFVDYQVPRYDVFAGSRTNLMYLRLLVNMGLNVKFIASDFERLEPYSSILNGMCIETLDGRWYRHNWKRWVVENAQHINYVFFNKPDPTIQFLDFIREHTSAKIIYQGHDLHFLRLQRKFEVDLDDRTLAEAKRYEKLERDIFSKSDAILSFSSYETEIISKLCLHQCVTTVPLYFYDKLPPSPGDFSARKDLLFVGGFAHAPNTDAVCWFCREVMPIILRSIPDVVLHVVGSDPPPTITALASDHVEIAGFVSDDRLRGYYNYCRIVVVPLRFGAGVKGKVVEALCHGIPIVSTSVGIEGLGGIETLVPPTDSAESFASRVVSTYLDLASLSSVQAQSRAFVMQRYSMETARKQMETLLATLAK